MLFQKKYCSRIYVKMSDDEFIALINEFKEEKMTKWHLFEAPSVILSSCHKKGS